MGRMSDSNSDHLVYKEESYEIQGAVFEVYREMGPGFLEPVYQECLAREFQLRALPYDSQPELSLNYKGQSLVQRYRPDFIVFGKRAGGQW